jgi:hypothetical protein
MNLWKEDYAAITHILSYPVIILGLLLHWPEMTNPGLVLWFTSFDVLLWKWVMHWHTRAGAGDVYWRLGASHRLAFHERASILAYRIPQHGIFWLTLLLIGYYNGWQYSVPTFLVWATFGCDVVYHWIGKEKLPAWNRKDYYGYGYWSFPVGWYYWLFRRYQLMPAHALYIQAIAGAVGAIAVILIMM